MVRFDLRKNLSRKELCTFVLIILAIVAIVLPISRKIMVLAVETLLNRDLDNSWWEEKLFTVLLIPLLMVFIYLLNYCLLKITHNRNIIYANILFFWVVSNFFIRLNGNFEGYKVSWDNGDFVDCIKGGYGSGTLYGTNYPPLAVLLFRWLHQYLLNDDGTISENAAIYITNMFVMIVILSLCICFYKLIKEEKSSILFLVVLFITSPMLFAIQRMNLMLIALVFSCIFLLTYNSDKRGVRFAGLLSLAISANIKFFPAIYGLILVKEKKWKEAIICAGLGLFLFLAPLLIPKDSPLVTNDYAVCSEESEVNQDETEEIVSEPVSEAVTTSDSSIKKLISSISEFANSDRTIGRTLSMQSVVYNILSPLGVSDRVVRVLRYAITILNAIFMIWAFFKTKRRDYELIILTLFSTFLISTSNWYFLIFLIPAFIEFVSTTKLDNRDSVLAVIWIALLVFRWGFGNVFVLQDWKYVVVLWGYLMVNILLDARQDHYQNKMVVK